MLWCGTPYKVFCDVGEGILRLRTTRQGYDVLSHTSSLQGDNKRLTSRLGAALTTVEFSII